MAPVETSTGVVLPILHPDFDHRDRANNNLHHPHFYGREYEDDSLAIRAVRHSRQQLVSKSSHENYHHFIDGTQKPGSPEEAFKITLLNAAKYIPALGVGMRAGFPEVIEISRRQRRQLRQPGVFHYEKTRLIKRALMDYTTSRELQPDDGFLIEEFIDLFGRADHLDDRSKRRLHRVGKRLVYEAIGTAVSPVEPQYQEARKAQMFAQGAPETAFRALRRFIKGREPNYFHALGRNLAIDLS
jgi:hypothetical protein